MIILIALVFIGMCIGYLLRKNRHTQVVNTGITLTIRTMLFILGLSVGQNPMVIHNLDRFGYQAVIISLASMLGSVLAGAFVYHKIYKKKGAKE